jgi:hypothetical protein
MPVYFYFFIITLYKIESAFRKWSFKTYAACFTFTLFGFLGELRFKVYAFRI